MLRVESIKAARARGAALALLAHRRWTNAGKRQRTLTS